MIKQNKPYGCGLYATANALNMPSFITEDRLEISKNGNNIGQITRWLNDDGYDIFIDTVKYTGSLIVIPKIEVTLKENILWFPALISIKSTKKKNHMVALRFTNEGRNGHVVEVMDSLMDEPFYVDGWEGLREIYPKIYGFFCFRNYDNDEICIIK